MSESADNLLDTLSDYVSARRARELRAAAAVHSTLRAVKEMSERQRLENQIIPAPVNGQLPPVANGRLLRIKCPITPKTEHVWKEIASGKTIRQVAKELRVSEKLIRDRRSSLYRILKVQGDAALTCEAIRIGLIHIPTSNASRITHHASRP